MDPLRIVVVLPLVLAACPKKVAPAPIVGWHSEEGWQHACYYPPEFAKLLETDRRLARSKSLDEAMTQWLGKREDGVAFSETVVEDVETTLLGRPGQIEGVIQQNLAQCQASATGTGGGNPAWESWLKALPDKLTAGECLTPWDYTMFDYLDIGRGWQRTMPICAGNRVRITASPKDKYRIADNGPWINVDGDPDQPAHATEAPCNMEGCFAGQLIGKFKDEQGTESIFPIGAEKVFSAPANGEIEYRINDDTFYDNTWYKSGGIIDHTSIEISPAP